MKIGIDARLTHYRTGGISTYTRNLVRELDALDNTNDYTILHSRKARQTIGPSAQRANLWTPCHHRWERTALSVELSRFQLDLLHSPDFIPPRRGARRHIISIHDLGFLHYPQFMTAESRRYYNAQIRAAVQQADHILAISQSTCRDVVQMLDVPPEKITVHPLGVDASFTPQSAPAVAAMRAQLELPAAYILFVGTFEPRKNIIGLLHAYQHLRQNLPDAPKLVVAGNHGWLFEQEIDKIRRGNLEDGVLWRENIPQQLLPALYSGALVHTLPSFYEGFGLPALEAMACGTVSIVSNASSLPEVVQNPDVLIDPHDPQTLSAALQRAITDDAWRARQERQAQHQAAKFTWSQTARIALDAYQKVMA